MKTASKKNIFPPNVSDRLAKILSSLILTYQVKLATGFSKRFNACSTRTQKVLLLSVITLAAAILLTGLFTKGYTIPKVRTSYKPATHIGMPSDINRTDKINTQLTDSLIKNH